MEQPIFDKDFDVLTYTNKRMLEMQSLPDRILYKEVVEKLFVDLYHHHEQSYETLTNKILNEIHTQDSGYTITIGLTNSDIYDETDTFLFPMQPEEKREVSIPEILETLEREESYYLYPMYLEDTYQKVQQFKEEQTRCSGTIQTTIGSFRATFKVEYDTRYVKQIKELYQIFLNNAKPWSTVCTAYLQRMFRVSILSTEGEEITGDYLGVEIDFLEYRDTVKPNVFPIWNISKKLENTSSYPTPAKDNIKYQHQIYSHLLGIDCDYLVGNDAITIDSISKNSKNLIIICDQKEPVEWVLFELHLKTKEADYPYPLLSNDYRESFTNDMLNLYKKSAKTRAEIARIINSFMYQEQMKYEGVSIEKAYQNMKQTYNMDDFILDEIRKEEEKQVMILRFTPVDKNYYLNADIMSFLVTQIQQIVPEYYCIGEMI